MHRLTVIMMYFSAGECLQDVNLSETHFLHVLVLVKL